MTAPPSCSAVLVSHDSEATLEACLQALASQEGVDLEIVVVDNASRRDPAGTVRAPAAVRWLRNPDNPGFAVACNQGAALARGTWLLFLNPDCLLPEGALAALIGLAQRQAGQGLLGAQLVEADGRLQAAARRLDPTPARWLRGRLELPAPRWAQDPAAAPEFEPLEAVSGALMLMPRQLFEAVGGFDAGYRLHVEDLDLCRRVREAGGWVGIAPRVRVTHLKGTSSRRRPLWVEWQKHRGLWRYFCKFDRARAPWWAGPLLLLALAAHLVPAGVRALWRARRPPPAPYRAT